MLENGGYMIPANSKKGNLILGILRPIDLCILLCGVTATVIMAFIFSLDSVILTIIVLLPLLVSLLLVAPVPNYHNILVMLTSLIKFYSNRRFYIWKGWNFYEYYKSEK